MWGWSRLFLGNNQYFEELNVSCSMTLHGGRGVRTLDFSLLRLRHERLILHITAYENAEYSNVHMTLTCPRSFHKYFCSNSLPIGFLVRHDFLSGVKVNSVSIQGALSD